MDHFMNLYVAGPLSTEDMITVLETYVENVPRRRRLSEYGRFSLDEISDADARLQFRFEKSDICLLRERLGIPDIMEYGHYITQEYSVLKNIFSYLTAKELKVCARVCREWKKMADKFVQYTVECYHKPFDAESWQDFNKLINPSLIFYLEIVKYGGRVDTLRGLVSKTYDVEDIPFYRMITAHPIFTPCVRGKINYNPEAVDVEKGQTLIFFPQIPGLKIKKFEFDKKYAVKLDQVEPLLSAKGVILLSEASSPCVTASNRIIHYLYFTGSKKKEVRSERPCLAGGLLAKTCRVDNEGKTIPSPVVAFTFEGDNVAINSDINKTTEFELFFKRLSENVGQKPNGAERFAFIFNCIGRTQYEDELEVFRKYFPDVPYFGFGSYGEFCIPGIQTDSCWVIDPLRFLETSAK